MSKFVRGNLRSGARKLTPTDVLDIRQRYAAGESQSSLCREYHVTVGTIGRIVRGESWQQFQQVETEFDMEARMVRPAAPQAEVEASFARLTGMLAITPDVVVEDTPGNRRLARELTKAAPEIELDRLIKGEDK